jgi:hypothetical protein
VQSADPPAPVRGKGALGRHVSRALVRENIRRYWPIGLVALLVYVVIGVIPEMIAAQYSSADIGDSGITFSSGISVLGFGTIGIITSVISAVAVFRYLHSPARLTTVHSFPVSRATHFISNFLSGLALSLAPFLISSLAVLAVVHDTRLVEDWGKWALQVCVIILFTYAVSVLAGMVTGNAPMHIITALFFNFAWMILYFFVVAQIKTGLFGLDFGDNSYDSVSYLHPMAYFQANRMEVASYPLAPGLAAYLLIALGALALAYFLYRAFRSERSGESITSRPVEYIFVFIAAFVGMFIGEIVLGFDGFDVYPERDPMTYVSPYAILGAVLGAVIAFVVAMMIVRRSARVFTLAALRRFGIFAVAAAVLMVCTLTNITGMETRVPNAAEVKTGAVSIDWAMLAPYKGGLNEGFGLSYYIPVSGDSDLAALAQLHREALKDKAYILDLPSWDSDYESSRYVKFAYGLKNGSRESRSYELAAKYLQNSNTYARLMSSKSVKEYFAIKNLLGYESLDMPYIGYRTFLYEDYADYVTPDTDVRDKLTPEALKELAACLDEDYMAMSANDMKDAGEDLFILKMVSTRPAGTYYQYADYALSGEGESLRSYRKNSEITEFGIPYHVTQKSAKTIAWLKEKGIYDSIVKSAAEIKKEAERAKVVIYEGKDAETTVEPVYPE